jgi:ATP-binding cassette, subfamily B, multidrug efflux pump
MSTIRTLTTGMEKKYVLYTWLSPLTMVGEVVMETVIPYFMAKIIDVGIANHDISYVLKIGLIMVCCAVLSLSCGVVGGRLAAVASQGFSHNLRRNLFRKVQDFSFLNIDKFSSASLVTRLTTDVTNTQNVYQMIIRMCARAPFMLLSGTIMACFINVKLALLFLIAIPVLAVAISIISSVAYPRFGAMLTKYDKMNNAVQENLIAIRVVKAFVRGKFESGKFEKTADDVRAAQLRAETVIVKIMPIMQIVIYISIIASLWFGGNMIVAGTMKPGELISFLTYVTQVLMSLMMLGMIFVMIVLSRASVARICEVLNEQSDITSPAPGAAVTVVRDGSVDFDNVSFSYNRRDNNCILRAIDIHISSGQVVGIIGGTGSSKTTLVSLLPRLYDVFSGSVKVGGLDVRSYDLAALRDAVAMVLQKNVLFSGTIRDNLKWGSRNATDEQLAAACRAADAESFITSFPNGYDTELGQGGVNISGGQKQRLCIARALLKNPKILILDDSTSAVDTATETRIRNALREEHPETTKIIIAQRISSVKDADIIFVLDDGCVNGSGTHEELLASNKIYREVYESQQNSGDADMESAVEGGN